MKKFIKTLILVICLIFPSLFCLTACENAEHKHEFATEWSSDASNHYHACTGDGCEEVADKEVHTFGEWTTSTNATCTENGEKYRECLECGHKETQTISATGHTFGEFIIDETPTTQTNGEGHRECSVCHEISKTTISALKSTGLAFELNEDKTSYSLTGIGACTDTFVNVPNKYNGLPVTAIKNEAFKDNKTITEIVLTNNITSIGEFAFENCSQLESVTIQNSVTTIGQKAFTNCSNLTNIIIPNSVTSIGAGAFSNCSKLTNITIPNNVTSIKECVFMGCSSLTSVIIPNNVTNIDTGAFNKCSGLISVIIPNSVTEIELLGFSRCSNLKNVYFAGTTEQWNLIDIKDGNDELNNATKFYYSETQPTTAGNYWRYVDGVLTEWINITLQVNTKTDENALTYGDAISYTASDVVAIGLVSGETIESLGTLSFVYSTEESGTYTSTLPKNVGTYYVKVVGCISNKYNITYTAGELEIKKAELTITVLDRTGNDALIYGDNAEYSTDFITVEGLKYDDTIASAGEFIFKYKSSLSSDYSPVLPKNAGTYSVMSEITNSANYTSTYVEGILEIKKATLTVTIPNIECTYGTIKGCETTITGFKYGEYRESNPEDTNPNKITIEENAKLYNPVTGKEIPTNGPSSYIDIGTYQYRPYYTAENYDFEYVYGNYVIVPKNVEISARFLTARGFYGQALNSQDIIVTTTPEDGFAEGENLSTLGTIEFEYSSDNGVTFTSNSPKNVGTYKVRVKPFTSEKSKNYNITYESLESYTIEEKNISITPKAQKMYYGETVTLDASCLNSINWEYDDESYFLNNLSFEFKTINADNYSTNRPTEVGEYKYRVVEITTSNYSIVYGTGTYIIERRPIKITIGNATTEYGSDFSKLQIPVTYGGMVYYDTITQQYIDEHDAYGHLSEEESPKLEDGIIAINSSFAYDDDATLFADIEKFKFGYFLNSDFIKYDLNSNDESIKIFNDMYAGIFFERFRTEQGLENAIDNYIIVANNGILTITKKEIINNGGTANWTIDDESLNNGYDENDKCWKTTRVEKTESEAFNISFVSNYGDIFDITYSYEKILTNGGLQNVESISSEGTFKITATLTLKDTTHYTLEESQKTVKLILTISTN